MSTITGILLFFAIGILGSEYVKSREAVPNFSIHVSDARAKSHWRGTAASWMSPKGLKVRVDGQDVKEPRFEIEETGSKTLILPTSSLDPGYHFVEIEKVHNAGRIEHLVDTIVSGPFQTEDSSTCDAALRLDVGLVRQIFLPAVREKILEFLRGQHEYFGSTTYIAGDDLGLVDGGFRYVVMIDTSDMNKGDLVLEFSATVRKSGRKSIAIELHSLDIARPGPKLEEIARRQGREKGGLLGALFGIGAIAVTGGAALPLVAAGAIGAMAGSQIGDDMGAREAAAQVAQQVRVGLENGLREFSSGFTLPSDLTVLEDGHALTASLEWCAGGRLVSDGHLNGDVKLVLRGGSTEARAFEQPRVRDAAIELDRLQSVTSGANAWFWVSSRLVNRLVAEWVARGGPQRLIEGTNLRRNLQDALSDHTRWRVQALTIDDPPLLEPGPENTLGLEIGRIGLTLHDPVEDRSLQLQLGGRAGVRINAKDPRRPSARLSLQEIYFGCQRKKDGKRVLETCFDHPMIDRDELVGVINRRLADSESLNLPDLATMATELAESPQRPGSISLDQLEFRTAGAGFGAVAKVN